MLHIVRCMLHVVHCMLPIVRCTLHVVRCIVLARCMGFECSPACFACCMLHAACCMLHVARRDAAMRTTAVVRCCNDGMMLQLQRCAHAPTNRYFSVAATSYTRRSRVLIMLATYDAAASCQGAACRRRAASDPDHCCSGPSRARTSRATATASSVRVGRRVRVRACGRARVCSCVCAWVHASVSVYGCCWGCLFV